MPAPRSRPATSRRPALPCLTIALIATALFGLGCPVDSVLIGTGGTVPSASFTQSATSGPPGTTIQFTDTSQGNVSSRLWDFGALGTSTAQNPSITFNAVGTYSVRLTVTGGGGSSTVFMADLVEVTLSATITASPAAASIAMPVTFTANVGNLPASPDERWEVGPAGSGVVVGSGRTLQLSFTLPGTFTVRYIYEDTTAGLLFESEVQYTVTAPTVTITASPPTAPAGALVTFTANAGALPSASESWGVGLAPPLSPAGTGRSTTYRFPTPGTYIVRYTYADISDINNPVLLDAEITYDVTFSTATAAIDPTFFAEGYGPLAVTVPEQSTGDISRWIWTFGDGEQCEFPADTGNPLPDCDAASPSHVYRKPGIFQIDLTVEGPDMQGGTTIVSDSDSLPGAVRVYLADPGFETQTANAEIGGGVQPPVGWTTLSAATPPDTTVHVARNLAGGADGAMPTTPAQWAVLDGIGTDGSLDVRVTDHGIRQTGIVVKSAQESVLEFDYALLFDEPAGSPVLDAVTATVTDLSTMTTVEIPSARATVADGYVGESALFGTPANPVRISPVFTASIDLLDPANFPAATVTTPFELTIRVANAGNGMRSPLAYVDSFRFVAPAAPVVAPFGADFAVQNPVGLVDPTVDFVVVPDVPANFFDQTCFPDPGLGCLPPTSWRWSFGTRSLTIPPSSSASAAQNPSYTFPAGPVPEASNVYDVKLTARRADRDDNVTKRIRVLGRPVASFTLSAGPYTAPATITAQDTSISDPSDPVVQRVWDFGGWGTPMGPNPTVEIGQPDDYVITLTVTTQFGQIDTFAVPITVDP